MIPEVSIVIPVYNEEENVLILASALVDVMEKTGYSYEVIFVDDGSTDGSRLVLKKICSETPNFRTIVFKHNAGQTAAMDAGFKAAMGKFVVSMDADLQNDPNDIPLLLEGLKSHDVVCGWRHKRNDPWVRRISAKVANFIRNKLSDEDIKDIGCSLKAYKRECLNKIKLYNGLHRFLPTLFKMEGFTVTEVKVNHFPRKHGVSKYGIRNRMFRAFYDLLVVRWMKKRRLNYEIVNE
ncbi:MAG: glycosyltransferase family 2 protein [Candidatus Brocadiales bacterium]|nr:glycosyltransferase family 2 protein [Candidatus Brocadiales bacterium]